LFAKVAKEELLHAEPKLLCLEAEGAAMTEKNDQPLEQPATFTPGITRAMVRQHAFELFRDKLPAHSLTLEDWVIAEKDLASTLDAENMPK
jgi:hypothetical protein